MRTLRTKYLSDIPINEDHYKVDFIILEKYQSFSSEILRLSLLGVAIYGFLIANVLFKITDPVTQKKFISSFSDNKMLLLLGAITLIAAALAALSHRYFSTDCMTHFIRGFRLRQKREEIKKEIGNDIANNLVDNREKNESELNRLEESVKSEEVSFEKDLNSCKWLLFASCFFLIAGILLITIALAYSFNSLLV
ncbi:hypothetical protein [Flavobacterium poyangense]|uniref:hypothetical protein n=1 Tax=Flavobacterium poyangense TaxID=2204302 RepID=UPI0014200AD8|nr:hypothetical protein [Flavobacterium sp. JXAS1]